MKIIAMMLVFIMLTTVLPFAVLAEPIELAELTESTELIAPTEATVLDESIESTEPTEQTELVESAEIEQAMADITYTLLTGNDSNIVSKSLYLPVMHDNGVAIKWSTSNKNYITDSGRVIRPRNDQFDEHVTLTAVFSYNGESASKEFEFTVLADEPFVDPCNIDNNSGQFMTDEEFFGVWDGSQWTVEGKFDYNNPKLSEIEDAAKQGNYTLAKQELLEHMKSRPILSAPGRNEPKAFGETYRILGYDISLIYHSSWDVLGGDSYREYSIPVRENKVKNYSPFETFNIFPADNDCAEVLIASGHHPNAAYRPRVEMMIDNELQTFEAVDCVTIRAGQYSGTNYGGEPDTKAKLFGGYLSDETYQTIIKFDFSGIDRDAQISSPRLILHCKQAQNFEEPKKLVLSSSIQDMDWDENNLTWDRIVWRSYNFNGSDLEDVWNIDALQKPGFDKSSSQAMSNWIGISSLAGEYAYTNDEQYAYIAITRMMEFISTVCKGNMPAGGAWSKEDEAVKLETPPRGGFYNPEQTQLRLNQFRSVMDGGLFRSEYMTPDACTALLKNAWDATDALVRYSFQIQDFGHRTSATMYSSKFFATFPEFKDSRGAWPEISKNKLELILPNYINSDGSVFQATTGTYMETCFDNPMSVKVSLEEIGVEFPEELNETFRRTLYYLLQVRFPGGTTAPVWGDDNFFPSNYTYAPDRYGQYMETYDEPYLRYLDSLGQKGDIPVWTSYQWPIGKQTMMRSGWMSQDKALYTSMRGAGNHGHYDDNSVVVYADGRTLLIDPGFNHNAYDATVKYDGISVYNYQMSTEQHNTIQINGANHRQTYNNNTNTIDDWATNSRFDFLQQTSRSYREAEHQRTITFLKSGFWIVSDLLTPSNMNASNTYKQLWHTEVNADISHDNDKRIFTNYPVGSNIIVASADRNDPNVSLVMEDGFNVSPWVPTKFSYYLRENTKGKTTFDTVLLPVNGQNGNINVDRIELGVPATEATAMKFLATVNEVQYRVYYLLDYEHNPGRTRTFEKYKTNGKMTVVREDVEGRVRELALRNGNVVSYEDGSPLLKLDGQFDDFAFSVDGSKLSIEASCDLEDLNGAEIVINGIDIKTVEFKKAVSSDIDAVPTTVESVEFAKDGDTIVLYGDSVPPVIEKDPVKPTLKPGFSGGSSGSNGGSVVIPPEPVKPVPDEPVVPPSGNSEFKDTLGHWAEEYIIKLKERGVIQGNPDGNFYPDSQITRAEILAMVVRALNIPESQYDGQFEDVSDGDWYSGVIQSALNAGLISKDIVFRPNDSITREEIAKIIVLSSGQEVFDGTTGDITEYTDNNDISGWAVRYVKTANQLGLMSGMTDGSFAPKGMATRAQAAAVIERLLTLLHN